MAVLEDDSDVIRTMMFSDRDSYTWRTPARRKTTPVSANSPCTVRQLVMEFGLNNVKRFSEGHVDSGNHESWIEVIHAVYPNIDRDTAKLNSKISRSNRFITRLEASTCCCGVWFRRTRLVPRRK
ncbi:portal protein [Klebsiella pneumoniae]|nr:portal protein [Klebsiella pneumoniae]